MFKDPKVLAGGAVLLGVAFWFFIKPQFFTAKPPPVYTAQQIAAAAKPTLVLEERVLNLKSPVTAPNYVKTSLALEFADPQHKYVGMSAAAVTAADTALTAEMQPDLPRIWDTVIKIVGGKSIDQVSTPDGQDALKNELMTALNTQLDPAHKVERVNFVSWITQ